MKILCLIDSLGSGGAQRQLTTLGVAFTQRGHQVRFVTYRAADFFAQHLHEHGIPIDCLAEARHLHWAMEVRRVLREAMSVCRVLRNGDHDAVLSFLPAPNMLAELAALPGRRWGLVVSERSAHEAGINSRIGRLARRLHPVADSIVTNSNAARQMLAAAFPSLTGKLTTIYNAGDFGRFSPVSDYLPRSDGRTRLVVAASYRALKNVHGVIQALATLTDAERARLQVDWYGSHGGVDHTRQAAHTRQTYADASFLIDELRLSSCITLHPAVSDIDVRMKYADVVGLFSFYEGLPNAVCEGMACGKPILMSNVSDAKYLVDVGRTGLLCDPHDPASIAECFRGFIEMTDETLLSFGKLSRAKAEALFDPEKIVDQFVALLQDAAEQHRPRSKVRAARLS